MKKFLLGLTILASMGTPALADPEIKKWKTNHAMGCMMVQECTDGVEEITKWEDLGPQFEPFSDELGLLISELNKMGVKVFLADDKYFWSLTRGLYYVKGNNMFLNKKYLNNALMMTKVVRHEAWHATQDCMAGTIDNTLTAVILQDGVVPDWVKRGADRTYPEGAAPYEAEAMWAAFNPGLVIQGVQACAGDVPMWEIFEPTPMTKEWLIEEGYYK